MSKHKGLPCQHTVNKGHNHATLFLLFFLHMRTLSVLDKYRAKVLGPCRARAITWFTVFPWRVTFLLFCFEFLIPLGECFYFQLSKENSFEISKVRKLYHTREKRLIGNDTCWCVFNFNWFPSRGLKSIRRLKWDKWGNTQPLGTVSLMTFIFFPYLRF